MFVDYYCTIPLTDATLSCKILYRVDKLKNFLTAKI